jgi:hypothetical protein
MGSDRAHKTEIESTDFTDAVPHIIEMEPGELSRYSDFATGWTTGGGDGSSSPGRVKYFHFCISSRPALGSTQPPIKWVPGAKRQGREADHSPPTSAEVKKMWIYTSTSLYVFMA